MISDELRAFVAAELKVDAQSLKDSDRLQHDLGLDGNDAAEFMRKYAERFHVDLTQFHFADHFGNESLGCIPLWIVWIVVPPLRPNVKPVTLAHLQKCARAGKWMRVHVKSS